MTMPRSRQPLPLLGGLLALLSLVTPTAFAFQVPPMTFSASTRVNGRASVSELSLSKNIVVISPPGGIGEISAVESAKLGNSVQWFIISPTEEEDENQDEMATKKSTKNTASFSEPTYDAIRAAGGSISLAGADAGSLLIDSEDSESAIPAVSAWCLQDGIRKDGLICTCDDSRTDGLWDGELIDAVKVAVREVCKGGAMGNVVLIRPVEKMDEMMKMKDKGVGGGVFGFLKKKAEVPETLEDAIGEESLLNLRHGALFGVPDSSKDSSPFNGGPRRNPLLRDEYIMRSIRIDPSITIISNPLLQRQTRSSRPSVGAAAARMALLNNKSGVDICLASIRGTDTLQEEEWTSELDRALTLSSSQGGQLFTTEFDSVPSTARLADWLATKWAPAILRSYNIAGIRVGARPVYANKVGDNQVEIVWQELIMKTATTTTIGRMIITVEDDNLLAVREMVNGKKGKPLAGEEELIRSLADAVGQAVEKGLAKKIKPTKQAKQTKEVAPIVQPATSIISSGTVSATPEPALESGPRTSGARRSSQRTRGTRRKSTGGEAPKEKTAPPKDESTDSFQ